MTRPHEDLDVSEYSIDFVKRIHELTEGFPSEEKYGLISQLRRASVSVPTNIAEGAARETKKEYLRFLSISSGQSVR
jgi:four helix bundle protein